MSLSAVFNDSKFSVGDTVRVYYKIIEKEVVSGKTKREKHEEVKERLQPFEGIVIAIRGGGENQNFIVRRIGSRGIGIERIFPLNSPWIKKIVIKKRGKVRRAKLYYLRQQHGKQIAKLELTTQNENKPKILATQTKTINLNTSDSDAQKQQPA